jgi:hypothetical protein
MMGGLVGIAALVAALPGTAGSVAGKRVLFIDSYNDDYAWSADISRAVVSVIEPSGAVLEIFRMDTKNHPDEDYKQHKAAEVAALIEKYAPDLVIACDDNASQYVVAPRLRNSQLPVVFCGINWDAAKYGFPATNVTGMVEVCPYPDLFNILKAAGGARDRVAMLVPDNETERADVVGAAMTGVSFREVRFVKTFDEWKDAYLDLQGKVDLVLVGNNAGITGWDDAEAERFVTMHTVTLTASYNTWMAPFVAVTLAKVGSEQGRWAAEAALKILRGAKPSDLPIAHNVQYSMILNTRMAALSKFRIPQAYFKAASKVVD